MTHKIVLNGLNTDRLPRLTRAESDDLLRKIAKGDNAAREYFLTANIRLVLSLVHRFHPERVEADDLFQAGCMGLVKALNNFDLRHNVTFSTYAVPMIIGEIKKHIRESSELKISRQLRDTAYQAMQAKERLNAEAYDEPTLYEVAEEMKVGVKEVVCALDALSPTVSLYDPMYNDGESSSLVMDNIGDKKHTDEEWLKHLSLRNAIEKLSDREKEVILLRYFEGKTQVEVSILKKISQAQVSRLEKSALSRLRKELSDE